MIHTQKRAIIAIRVFYHLTGALVQIDVTNSVLWLFTITVLYCVMCTKTDFKLSAVTKQCRPLIHRTYSYKCREKVVINYRISVHIAGYPFTHVLVRYLLISKGTWSQSVVLWVEWMSTETDSRVLYNKRIVIRSESMRLKMVKRMNYRRCYLSVRSYVYYFYHTHLTGTRLTLLSVSTVCLERGYFAFEVSAALNLFRFFRFVVQPYQLFVFIGMYTR